MSLVSYVGEPRVTEPCFFNGTYFFEYGSEVENEVDDALAIWGPIPEFELEGEEKT